MNRLIFENVIDEILQEFQSAIDQSNIRIIRNVYQTEYFYSDKDKFRMIFLHLIGNAIVFSDDQKRAKSIEINVRATSTGCSIQINDNGIGIDDGIQNKIFDLFYQGSEKSNGSGVGLYIVREILRKMGGSISVDSIARRGSTFLAWVPLWRNRSNILSAGSNELQYSDC
jgi:signal transduction histidine kinase